MATPAICVAMPVRNGAAYLAAAIESVLSQAGVELELRIRDNLSTDDSVAIARSYCGDARVHVDINEHDVHYYGSLNRILADTEAPYFVPFACDDLMRPGNLAAKLAAVQETGAGLAQSPVEMIDGADRVIGVWPEHLPPRLMPAPEFFTALVPLNTICCQTVLVRTDALRAIGGFDGRSLYSGDWLSWLRISLRHAVVTLPEPLVANRVHAGSGTNASNASGFNARDVPAALHRAFDDPLLPAPWRARRDGLVARAHVEMALVLERSGRHRVSAGWAAYMAIGHALARQPHDPQLRANYTAFVQAAGLCAPALPAEAVALLPRDEADARALRAAADELGGLVARILVAVAPDAVDEALDRLGPVFGECAHDVNIVPTEDPVSLFVPGCLALAGWESEAIALAEARGLPVWPYGVPNPLLAAARPENWQTVDAAALLP